MRRVSAQQVSDLVEQLCLRAAFDLPADVQAACERAASCEQSPLGRWAMGKVCRNIELARSEQVPLCQDTGLVVVFAQVGQEVAIEGGAFEDAVNAGVARAYEGGYLRKSIVSDPLFDRRNTGDNTPAVLHVRLVPGSALRLLVMPKGGGSENMCRLGMLKPAQGAAGVEDFVVRAVVEAGGNPCPPTIVGVGVGGNAERALLLSKEALAREVGAPHPDERYAALEARILERVNASGVGPQGFGGTVTALAVHVEAAPTHIAMLPVAVTLNCHAARHASGEL